MREPLPALVALVRFLPRVQSGVLDEMVFVFEGFLADLALVRPLACRDTKQRKNERDVRGVLQPQQIKHTHTHTSQNQSKILRKNSDELDGME